MENQVSKRKKSFRIAKRKEELSKELNKPQIECLEQATAEIEAEDNSKKSETKQD
ncbi:hypothetical protein [Acinetobacter sp.]|uniref:hypothetical protein n=1 Tax=Acinetobacter sp. TaxID=472 RepID=UPI0025C13257|nr:hypothetical protein [Acinetobacter sp.]